MLNLRIKTVKIKENNFITKIIFENIRENDFIKQKIQLL